MAQEPGTQHFMVLQEVGAAPLARAPARRPRDRSATPRSRRCGRPATPSVDGTHAADQRQRRVRRPVSRQRERRRQGDDARRPHRRRPPALRRGRLRAREAEFDLVDRDIQPALQTFRQLSPQEASNVRPNRIEFYVVRQGDSWQSIAARQSKGFVNAATLAIMNDRDVSAQPQPGDRVKIVVEGSR